MTSSKKKESHKFGWCTIKDVIVWYYKDFTSLGGITQSRLTDITACKVIWILLYFVGSILTWINIARIGSIYQAREVATTFSQV